MNSLILTGLTGYILKRITNIKNNQYKLRSTHTKRFLKIIFFWHFIIRSYPLINRIFDGIIPSPQLSGSIVFIVPWIGPSIRLSFRFLLFSFSSQPGQFFTLVLIGGLQWNLNGNKSVLVSRTLPNILADLNRAILCMVSIPCLISNSYSLLSKPIKIVLCETITTDVTQMSPATFTDFLVLYQGPRY